MKIKHLLTDLDGVIRIFPSDHAAKIEEDYQLPKGAILAAAFHKPLLNRAVCGEISDEQWRAEVAVSLADICGTLTAEKVITEWSEFSGMLNNRYLNLVATHFTGIPVSVLTNATSRLNNDLTRLGIAKAFHRIFNSAEIGVCKPDRKIFEHVVEQLACDPAEILFVDDSLSHAQAAGEIGMQTYHYQSFEEFQNFVRKNNVSKGK